MSFRLYALQLDGKPPKRFHKFCPKVFYLFTKILNVASKDIILRMRGPLSLFCIQEIPYDIRLF